MKKILPLLLLLLVSLKSYSSQLAIGLISENLVAWNVWEYKHGELKQHLLLFNQSKKEIAVTIKEKRYYDNGITFKDISTDTTFHELALAAGKLVKVPYPQSTGKMVFMEFLEDGEKIGLLEINPAHPPKAFVQKKYGYYSSEGINSGLLGFWVKLTSIYDPNATISFGYDQGQRKYEMSQLIKVLQPGEEIPRDQIELAARKATDKSILEINPRQKEASFRIKEKAAGRRFIPVPLLANHLEKDRLLMSAFTEIGIFKPD